MMSKQSQALLPARASQRVECLAFLEAWTFEEVFATDK
jgi:hypothetical protein